MHELQIYIISYIFNAFQTTFYPFHAQCFKVRFRDLITEPLESQF